MGSLWKSWINLPDPGINKDAFWIKDSNLFYRELKQDFY